MQAQGSQASLSRLDQTSAQVVGIWFYEGDKATEMEHLISQLRTIRFSPTKQAQVNLQAFALRELTALTAVGLQKLAAPSLHQE